MRVAATSSACPFWELGKLADLVSDLTSFAGVVSHFPRFPGPGDAKVREVHRQQDLPAVRGPKPARPPGLAVRQTRHADERAGSQLHVAPTEEPRFNAVNCQPNPNTVDQIAPRSLRVYRSGGIQGVPQTESHIFLASGVPVSASADLNRCRRTKSVRHEGTWDSKHESLANRKDESR